MIYLSREGNTFGPYAIETARAYMRTGYIKGTDLVWSEGQDVWVNAHEHPLLKIAQPPPLPETGKIPHVPKLTISGSQRTRLKFSV
jgi:hypothetical protein